MTATVEAAKTTRRRKVQAKQAAEAREALRDVTAELAALGEMTTGELRDRWAELFGEEPRSRNKKWLRKRLAHRIQELAEGGLTERARARIDELADGAPIRHRPPRGGGAGEPNAKARDPRLPPAGTILTPKYKGVTFEITVLDDGFTWNGETYKSLSAVAKAATGQIMNGYLWCKLARRKRSTR